MPSDACWICKDRKVSCDRIHPQCSRCARAKRQCHYGLRLSWPKPNDKRRTLRHTNITTSPSRYHSVRYVHAGFWDIRLHNFVRKNGQDIAEHQYLLTHFSTPALNVQINPYHLDGKHGGLLEYFCTKVFSRMGNFDQDKLRFHGLLHRLTFSNDSLSSTAIIQAALALSSLHRHGLKSEALLLKLSALQTLGNSTRHGMSAAEGIQHVVAGMMLCYFEIEDLHNTPVQWMLYVIGSKNLIQALKLREQSFSTEFSAVLDWVDYHFVVSMFTFRHWQQTSRPHIFYDPAVQRVVSMKELVRNISDCSHVMLDLLYEVTNTIKRPTDQGYFSPAYAASLKDLEERIISTQPFAKDLETKTVQSCSLGVEIYRVATLIYLERASCNFSGHSAKISLLSERGFEILRHQDVCSATLPVFIIGLEAKTDEQRRFILDRVERNDNMSHLRSMEAVSRMLQAAWNQDDLETENDVDYILKLDTIITSNSIIPTLA